MKSYWNVEIKIKNGSNEWLPFKSELTEKDCYILTNSLKNNKEVIAIKVQHIEPVVISSNEWNR